MIYLGTDDGIYRWFEGSPWPVFHSLQGRSILALAAPGGGVLAAVDRDGPIWETETNGLDWRAVPLPAGSGRPLALAAGGAPALLALATRPLHLYRRAPGAAGWTTLPTP